MDKIEEHDYQHIRAVCTQILRVSLFQDPEFVQTNCRETDTKFFAQRTPHCSPTRPPQEADKLPLLISNGQVISGKKVDTIKVLFS